MNKRSKIQFLKNVASGWLAVALSGVAGLAILPINLRFLGKEVYGVSVLAVAVVHILSYLSFGMGPILVRFFARYAVENDRENFKLLSSTSQTILGALGLVGAAAMLGVYPFFVDYYSIAPELRGGLFVLFVSLAFSCFENLYTLAFLSIIQASHRYDFGNFIRIVSVLIRLVALYVGYLIFPPTLGVLGVALFLEAAFKLLSLFFFSWRLRGSDAIWRPSAVSWEMVPSIFSYSFLNFINSFCYSASLQIPVFLIGRTLGKAAVAAYSPAGTIGGAVGLLLYQICMPLTPLAAEDKLKNKMENLGRWATTFSEIVAYFAVGCLLVFALFGGEILTLWLGSDFAWTKGIVVWIVLGVCVATIQAPNNNLALGSATIAPFAYSSAAMMVAVAIGLALGLYRFEWSLMGVATYVALVRTARNAVYIAFVYSGIFKYRYWNYVWRAYVKPFAFGAVFWFAATWLKGRCDLDFANVFVLVPACCVLWAAFEAVAVLGLGDDETKKKVFARLTAKFRKAKGDAR